MPNNNQLSHQPQPSGWGQGSALLPTPPFRLGARIIPTLTPAFRLGLRIISTLNPSLQAGAIPRNDHRALALHNTKPVQIHTFIILLLPRLFPKMRLLVGHIAPIFFACTCIISCSFEKKKTRIPKYSNIFGLIQSLALPHHLSHGLTSSYHNKATLH